MESQVFSASRFAALQAWVGEHTDLGEIEIDRPLSGGNANLTLRLHSALGPVVLRTPPESTISAKAHRGIQREAAVLKALQGRVKVPEVLAWCEDAEILGRPFLIVSHVEGVPLTDSLPPAYPDTAASVNTLGEALVDELAALHQVPWREVGLADFGNPDGYLLRQIDRWQGIRAETTVRELPLLNELAQWLRDKLPAASPVAVIHGDYHLDNTLVSVQRPELQAVIDWELATIGDPLSDLGLFLMFWGPRQVEPPGFQHVQALSRRAGIVTRRELAARWQAATGISTEDLDYYLCFAFWRLAAIVEGAYCLYREGKVDTAYARGLEYDVPALLEEAKLAAGGGW